MQGDLSNEAREAIVFWLVQEKERLETCRELGIEWSVSAQKIAGRCNAVQDWLDSLPAAQDAGSLLGPEEEADRSRNRWFSVNDRLPDDMISVLASDEHGDIWSAYYESESTAWVHDVDDEEINASIEWWIHRPPYSGEAIR